MSHPTSSLGSTWQRIRQLLSRSLAARRLCVVLGSVICSALAGAAWTGGAVAQQRADYMLDFQPEGTRVHLDYFGSGGIVRLEHVKRIFGSSNDVVVGASLAPTYPLGEAAATADLRILFLSLGVAAGYRAVWRNMVFEAGDDEYCVQCDRGARRNADSLFGDTPGSDHWGWGEVRARVFMPFNDYFVGLTAGSLRHEGRQDRSFDWFNSTIYDGGLLGKWETMFFLKHRDWGGIGPYVQLLVLPRDGQHEGQLAVGLNAVTRLGLLKRNDLLFITFLARPGDDHFGQHSYFAPVRGLINYRMSFDL